MNEDDQLPLPIHEVRSRLTDPGTSYQAADSVDLKQTTRVKRIILRMLARHDLTDERIGQIWQAWEARGKLPPVSPSGLRTRRSELVADKLVEDSGHRQTMESGRRAIIWKLTDSGRRLAEQAKAGDQ